MQYGTSYGSTWHHLTKVLYSTFKDMVLYSTKSGSHMITCQETLLVLCSTIFFRVIIAFVSNRAAFFLHATPACLMNG